MALYDHNFDTGEAVTAAPLKFLSKLEALVPPNLQSVCQSLAYLDNLSQKSEDPDTANFREELLVIAEGFQQRVLKDDTPINWERLEEVLNYDVEVLFNSLSNELREAHNHTLQTVAEQMLEPELVEETLQQSIDPSLKEVLTYVLQALKEKVKIKLSAKQLVQVLAACAVLSIPSDKVQYPEGPSVMARAPEQPTVVQVQDDVTQVIRPRAIDPVIEIAEPPQLQEPTVDRPPNLSQNAPFSQIIIDRETPQMQSRLDFVLDTPARAEYLQQLQNHPGLDPVVPIVGIIESNLDVNAVSQTGARGPFQDMGRLQGAFGDIQTLDDLINNDLLPNLENTKYNQAKAAGGFELQQFLIREQEKNSPVWRNFLTGQRNIITDPKRSAFVSHFYLRSLQDQAAENFGYQEHPAEAMNLALMAYNGGMESLKDLRDVMASNGQTDFSSYSAGQFVNRADFNQLMQSAGKQRRISKLQEATTYLGRAVALTEIIDKLPTT